MTTLNFTNARAVYDNIIDVLEHNLVQELNEVQLCAAAIEHGVSWGLTEQKPDAVYEFLDAEIKYSGDERYPRPELRAAATSEQVAAAVGVIRAVVADGAGECATADSAIARIMYQHNPVIQAFRGDRSAVTPQEHLEQLQSLKQNESVLKRILQQAKEADCDARIVGDQTLREKAHTTVVMVNQLLGHSEFDTMNLPVFNIPADESQTACEYVASPKQMLPWPEEPKRERILPGAAPVPEA